ncbi:MAG: LexA family transcriptional regulator [Bacteroidetes bacterium]|nr:LexA family transcriptional regulator [Bacteroidota bacterium]
MNFLASNIRFLRKQFNLTQDQLSVDLNVNRSMIGAYEEGRAIPRINMLQAISVYFSFSLDQLINTDLSLPDSPESKKDELDYIKGSQLRVLTTIVDTKNRELITVVPVKATAGYLNSYADPEYVGQLPHFTLPVPELSSERTRRVFQIRGDSMLPVQPGTYVLCDYLQDWTELHEGQTYILLTLNEGIIYKRVYSKTIHENTLLLKSDNPDYEPYIIALSDVCEIWRAIGTLNFNLSQTAAQTVQRIKKYGNADEPGLHQLAAIVMEMRKELDELKGNV